MVISKIDEEEQSASEKCLMNVSCDHLSMQWCMRIAQQTSTFEPSMVEEE